MLAATGAASMEDLLSEIPEDVRLKRPLDLPAGLAESEVFAELSALAGRNTPATELVSFLGAGVYDHYVPAVVDAITGRSEFQTSYTPYQPERSQGNLQAIFEFQTAICELTGLQVSNASLYDGATALAEAAILAAGQTGRRKIVLSTGIHPEYRQVLATESAGLAWELVEVATEGGAGGPGGGRTSAAALRAVADDQTAAVILQQPGFFGALEHLEEAAAAAHNVGALFITVVDPLALGLLKTPGECGADIAVGEAQALGNALNFGGPHVGFMAVTQALVRRLPGRLVGETVDVEGKRGFVLTLQTREQHIRRERATSNICSNQALNALATLVHLSWLGKQGLPELGVLCARKADYLREALLALPGIEPFTIGPVFREFAVRLPRAAAGVIHELAGRGYLAGVDAGRWYPGLDDVLLVAVTERRTRVEMDGFVGALRDVVARQDAAEVPADLRKEAPRG
jgi:glycine dehydrogenase subunit 1